MSDIKIQPSATGSATVTLTAPATSTARTVTLPDSTDTLAVNSDVTNKLPLAGGTMTGALSLQNNVSNSTSATLKLTGSSNVTQDNFILFGDNATSYPIAMGFDNSENTFKIARSANDDLNSNIYFKMSSTGVISAPIGVELGGGLTAATANTLDDYEEGTWTPTLSGTSGGPSGVNFTYRLGWYTKIGRVVIADCRIAMSSWSSGPSGSALISGLPFNAPASSNYFASPTIGYTHNFDSDNAPKGGFVEEGSSVIRLIKANDTSARQVFSQNVSASALNGNETIFISVAYIVSA